MSILSPTVGASSEHSWLVNLAHAFFFAYRSQLAQDDRDESSQLQRYGLLVNEDGHKYSGTTTIIYLGSNLVLAEVFGAQ